MATSRQQSGPQTRIIVVNMDAGWQFTRLVRQHAADLYRQVPAVRFWEATGEEEPPGEHTAVWRDWPLLKQRSRETLAEDLIEEVQAAGADIVILVFVITTPEWFDAQPDLPFTRRVLDTLGQTLRRTRRRQSRVQRFAVFRCRPAENEDDWLQDRAEVAYRLLADGLSDHSWFLAADADNASEQADFAGLRVLIELFADAEERQKLRPTGREGTSAVRWLKSFANAPPSQVDGVRALLTRIIDDFERTAGTHSEQDPPANAENQGIERLSTQIDAMLKSMTGMLDDDGGGAGTPSAADDLAAARWLDATLWFHSDGIERDYEKLRDESVRKIVDDLKKRIENLKSDRQETLRPFRIREKEIIASIEGLAATRLGRRGSAKTMLEGLVDRVEDTRVQVQEKLKEHRKQIIATALPIVLDGDAPGTIKTALRELKEFADLDKAMLAVTKRVSMLPQRLSFVLLLLIWLAVVFLPLIMFHLGNSLAPTVGERLAAMVPMAWPGSHMFYWAVLAVVGGGVIARPVLLKHRSLRKRLDDLLWRARDLRNRADAALDSSLKYAQHDYALGWCTLLVERLQALRAGLDRAEEFTQAFEPLRLKGQVDKAVLDRLTQELLPQLRERSREEWLPLLLDVWPDGQEVRVELGGEGRLSVRSRFLTAGFASGEQELRIDVVPNPGAGTTSGEAVVGPRAE